MAQDDHFVRCIGSQRNICHAKPKGSKKGFTLAYCKDCQHGFIEDDVTEELLANYYTNNDSYSNSTFEEDLKQQQYPGSRSDAWRYLHMIKEWSGLSKPRLLEVGAGWGYASERACQMGWEVDAIEYSEECVQSLRKRLPNESKIFHGSFEDFPSTERNKYDAILMSQVLEHARDPLGWLTLARGLLSETGVLVVAVPQYLGFFRSLGMRDPFIIPPEHLNYFTRNSLTLAAEKSGFSSKYITGYSRIPYHRIRARLKNGSLSLLAYRITQGAFFIADKLDLSMIQVQVFVKIPNH